MMGYTPAAKPVGHRTYCFEIIGHTDRMDPSKNMRIYRMRCVFCGSEHEKTLSFALHKHDCGCQLGDTRPVESTRTFRAGQILRGGNFRVVESGGRLVQTTRARQRQYWCACRWCGHELWIIPHNAVGRRDCGCRLNPARSRPPRGQRNPDTPFERDAEAQRVAAQGGATLVEVAEVIARDMGYPISRERIRQIEEKALKKLRRNGGGEVLAEYLEKRGS